MFSRAEFYEFHEPLVGSGLRFFLFIPNSFLMIVDFVFQSISPLNCSANVKDGNPSFARL